MSLTVGISPARTDISEKPNETICKNFSLIGDQNLSFEGDIKWSTIKSNNVSYYNHSSYELGINSSFPNNISSGVYTFCIKSLRVGNYYGILIYSIKDSNYKIGMWINLEVRDKNNTKVIENIILSGKDIINLEFSDKYIFIFSLILSLSLIFILFKLIFKYKSDKFK